MRILFITPYPSSRIRVRSYSFVTHLAKLHHMELLVLWAGAQELADVQALQREGLRVRAIHEPRLLRYLRSLASLGSELPLQVAFDASARLRAALCTLLAAENFDLLHVEFVRTLGAIPQNLPLPVVWDAVDCVSQLYQKAADNGATPITRLIGQYEARRMRSYECAQLQRFQQVLVTTEHERQALLATAQTAGPPGTLPRSILGGVSTMKRGWEGCDSSSLFAPLVGDGKVENCTGQTFAPITVITQGVDQQYFQPYTGQRQCETLVFSGKMSFHANIAGVRQLVEHILPLIWQKRPHVKLIIAGSHPTSSIARFAHDPRITVTGYVPDLRPYISQAYIAVCPLPYAVGTQIKVLEAMALGTPVIASSHVAAGLQATAGHELLIADEPATFAAAVLRLLDDPVLWNKLVTQALAYIATYHNWDQIIAQLIAVYTQALYKQ